MNATVNCKVTFWLQNSKFAVLHYSDSAYRPESVGAIDSWTVVAAEKYKKRNVEKVSIFQWNIWNVPECSSPTGHSTDL